MKYRTIVADPPWPIEPFAAWCNPTKRSKRERELGHNPTPYLTMSLGEIESLPVAPLAENDAHLYLWTINQFFEQSFAVVRAWEFRPSAILTWVKAPMGLPPTRNPFAPSAEYVIFARRGTLKAKTRLDRSWWNWKRTPHSQKPEAFLDIVEQVSPGPYLELFARRQRLGWDTWGNEALEHVAL